MTDLADGLTEKRLRETLRVCFEFMEHKPNCRHIMGDGHPCVCHGVHRFDQAREALALPKSQAEKQAEALLESKRALDELIEVAELRGDNTLPAPPDDPKLWTARMQVAWNEAEEAIKACRDAGIE